MFKILFDGENPFEDLSPTPMVSRTTSPIHYAAKHGEIDSFRLEGYVTGDCSENNFSGLFTSANELINRFCSQFKKMQIIEDVDGLKTGYLYEGNYSLVRNINFAESPFSSYLPYSIDVDVYAQDSFSSYGVLEPQQEISFQQLENGTVACSKTVSARGFNTDRSALENATNFVNSHSGWNNEIIPLFIPSGSNPILASQKKEIDRTIGRYSISEEYIYQYCGNQNLENCILLYSVDTKSGENGISLGIEGSIKGGANTSLQNLRDSFSSLNFLEIAEENYPLSSFYDSPISKSITENIQNKEINFSFSFSDFVTEDPYIVDTFSVTLNAQDNKSCATASIEIKSNIGCREERLEKVENFANSFDMRGWINSKWQEYGISGEPKGSFSSFSQGVNPSKVSANLSATLCEKKIEIPDGFLDIDYSVNISPPLPKFAPFYGIDCLGAVTVQKMQGNTRRNVSISGQAIMEMCSVFEDSKNDLKNYINQIKSNYLNEDDAFLTECSINNGFGESERVIYFSFSWSENGPQLLPNELLHSPIS
jgi:hypothetical protein